MSESSKKPTAPRDRVPFWEKLALGVGALSAFFGYAGVSTLAYPVYNMLLKVNAGWVGTALMIPRIWDAFSDPIMGYISDNFHSRFGRRKPFIVIGAISMGVLFALLWYVPESWSDSAKIIWFIGLQLIYFTCYTIFAVPYGSLSYELTPDYNERTRVMAYCAFFHKSGEFLSGWMIPLATALGAWLIAAEKLEMTGIHSMAWLIGLLVMAGLGSMPGLLVRERFVRKTAKQSKVKILDSIKDSLSSKAFVVLVAVIVLNTLSGVLASGIDQYLLVYYMNDGSEAAGLLQKGLLTSGYAVVGFISIPIITWLASLFGKKGSLYFVYSLMAFGGVMKWFIFAPGHPIWDVNLMIVSFKLDPVILIDPLLCGPMWVAVKIMLASMMADICDEDELLHGQRREGMFSAVFSWIEKAVVSFSYMGTGIALNFSGFSPDFGAEQPAGTFFLMRLFLAGAPAITAVMALFALYFYPITAQHAEKTRAALEERRGAISADQ
ncbi:MFS transporter [Candidatus Sumerlaeota bacterium]|nr:MFS transporter [Candidatus Sumerlaeota bacterium]